MEWRREISSDQIYQRALPMAGSGGGGFRKMRLLMGLAVAAFALISYFSSSEFNPITGENQHISITPEQEVALGMQSAPKMAAEFGGLHPDARLQAQVDAVGRAVVAKSGAAKSGYPFEFHLLADEQTVNAFALPGGPVFITAGLYRRLETEGQLAGVLGHEVGHVVARHSAQQIAQQELTQGLTGAVVMSTYDPTDPSSQGTAQIAMVVANLVNMKYGRGDELQSDRLGVRFMSEAGYDPSSLIGVMQILEVATGGNRPSEFFSTHPNPENRIAEINKAIQETFPDGIPRGLKQ